MPTAFKGVNVLCPYYADKEDIHCITCEGVSKNTLTKVCFKTQKAKDLYRFQFCERHYSKCRIAKMLDEKWEEH